jgi:Uma2 family endonuclease
MAAAVESKKKIWTEAELQALPEDGYLHEVVNGELVMSPKNNWQHGNICAELLMALCAFAKSRKLGAVFDSSTGFWMENLNCRAPDISFVSKERLRGLKRNEPRFFPGAPDLAVEILSPSNSRREVDERLRDFFSSGTRLAWVIDPERELVEICRSVTQRRLLAPNGTLDGEDVLPGFTFAVAELFQEWEW